MKILILASNPRKDLNLDREIRQLKGVIKQSGNSREFEIEDALAVRVGDLQDLLFSHRPQIVHFCGHGSGQQGLVFEGSDGGEQWVRAEALSELFRLFAENVGCVLLNACYSEEQANAIVNHIDYVIGMNQEIRDDAAIAFSKGFYRALGYECSIEQAYEFGRNAIQLEISGSSKKTRSTVTEAVRKIETVDAIKRVVIPEHLKPILKTRLALMQNLKPVVSASEQVLSQAKREEIQLDVAKVLTEEKPGLNQFREQVKEYLQDHYLAEYEKDLLGALRDELGLSIEEAGKILEEEQAPFRQAQQAYEKRLVALLKYYPFSDVIQEELRKFQVQRKLTDEEVNQISQPILEQAEADYQVKLTMNRRDSLKAEQAPNPSIGQNAYDRKMPVAGTPNANFSTNVENLDVTFEVALTAEEMTAGTERHIVTEQGGVVVKIPSGVSAGKRIRVRGKGRFDSSTQQRGHLYLLINQRDSLPERKAFSAKCSANGFEFQVPTIATQGFFKTKLEISYKPGRAEYFEEDLGDGIVLKMVAIPSGSFQMGATEEFDDEKPVHKVAVQAFYMGKFAITQAQWRAVAALPQVSCKLDADPSYFKGNKHPVENVSWYEAVEFCNRLSQKTGKTYRLPSEAEWEYACRAGTKTPFSFGETITTDLANYRGTDWEYEGTTYFGSYGAGPKGEYRQTTIPIDQFDTANAFGLCDMHGNVFEWCQDHWRANYQGAPSDGSAWLTDNEGGNRVVRGGSWFNTPRYCRSARRDYNSPVDRYDRIGFRVSCPALRT